MLRVATIVVVGRTGTIIGVGCTTLNSNGSHLLVQAQWLTIRCANVERVDGHLGPMAARACTQGCIAYLQVIRNESGYAAITSYAHRPSHGHRYARAAWMHATLRRGALPGMLLRHRAACTAACCTNSSPCSLARFWHWTSEGGRDQSGLNHVGVRTSSHTPTHVQSDRGALMCRCKPMMTHLGGSAVRQAKCRACEQPSSYTRTSSACRT